MASETTTRAATIAIEETRTSRVSGERRLRTPYFFSIIYLSDYGNFSTKVCNRQFFVGMFGRGDGSMQKKEGGKVFS